MHEFYELADKFLKTRRSLPYVKFDKKITKKINSEICILSYLKSHNGEAHPKELSREFIVSTPRMAVILNKLEKKGYITRILDSEDNRQTIVKIKKEGILFFEEENRDMINFMAGFFEKIGERDAKEFLRMYSMLMNYSTQEK